MDPHPNKENQDNTKKIQLLTSPKSYDQSFIVFNIQRLFRTNERESALVELCRKKEEISDLPLFLWFSPSVISLLLTEVISVYPHLTKVDINDEASVKIYNILALFQIIAGHKDIKRYFIHSQMIIYFYPFLNTINKTKSFEYLRLTTLGVIGALVKSENTEVIMFLLRTEIIPLCLRIMERGSDVSKTVATFIIQRILLDAYGLEYICSTAERFYAVSYILNL